MARGYMKAANPAITIGRVLERPPKCFGHLVENNGIQFSVTRPGCNCRGEKERGR